MLHAVASLGDYHFCQFRPFYKQATIGVQTGDHKRPPDLPVDA